MKERTCLSSSWTSQVLGQRPCEKASVLTLKMCAIWSFLIKADVTLSRLCIRHTEFLWLPLTQRAVFPLWHKPLPGRHHPSLSPHALLAWPPLSLQVSVSRLRPPGSLPWCPYPGRKGTRPPLVPPRPTRLSSFCPSRMAVLSLLESPIGTSNRAPSTQHRGPRAGGTGWHVLSMNIRECFSFACSNNSPLNKWASSGRWWRTGKPGELQSMGSQRVRHDLATERPQHWTSYELLIKWAMSLSSQNVASFLWKRQWKKRHRLWHSLQRENIVCK